MSDLIRGAGVTPHCRSRSGWSCLVLAVVMGASVAPGVEIRLNCGTQPNDPIYRDVFGRDWIPDQAYATSTPPRFGYVGGAPGDCLIAGPAGGTFDATLYATNRVGLSEYRFDVPNGLYAVRLHFAETCLHTYGLRVGDLMIEGLPMRTAFDIAAEVGKDYAIAYTYPAWVTDGTLNVWVNPLIGDSLLSAISVISVAFDTLGPEPPGAYGALGGFGQNILTWDPNPEDDWSGYNIYRSESALGPFERVNIEPVVTPRYLDSNIVVGRPYYYRVRALDIWGNEGPPTAVASATASGVWQSLLPVYDLTISESDLVFLNLDPFSEVYVPGGFAHANVTYGGVQVGYSGSADRQYSKKSWRLLFPGGNLFNGRSAVTLHSEFSDFSLIREFLSNGLAEAAGVPGPSDYFVHLNLNGVYHGVYLDVSEIDPQFLIQHGLDPGGNLYQTDYGTLDILQSPEQYPQGYVKKTNLGEGYEDLIDFIEVLNGLPDDAVGPAMHQMLDMPEYLNYYALMILTGNVSFTASDYALYHDPQSDKWMVFPWNLVSSFGIAPWVGGGQGWATPIDLGVQGSVPEEVVPSNRLITRLLQVDAFRDYVAELLHGWIEAFFNSNIMDPNIDLAFGFIAADARRDVRKFGWEQNDAFNVGPAALKEFVANRGPFLLAEIPGFAPLAGPYLYINEFAAENATIIADEFGEHDDWVEIYNAAVTAANIGGMYLTNDLSDPTRWRIPEGISIPGGGHVLFWADNQPVQGDLHAAFELAAGGGEIGLFGSDGVTEVDAIVYGPQTVDVSYGRLPDGVDAWQFFAKPTPDEWNLLLDEPPSISETRRDPLWPREVDSVVILSRVVDNRSVESVDLVVDIGGGPFEVEMFDDGLHGEGQAGDGEYGSLIAPLPRGTVVQYYVRATDNRQLTSVDPPGAPGETYSYEVGATPGIYSPAEGATVQAKHVLFNFEPIDGAASYELEVVVDTGGEDPFVDPPVVEASMRRPRQIVTTGLQFGEDYAWRVRGLDAEHNPGPWLPIHRFDVLPLPNALEGIVSVINSQPQRYQPGVTLFDVQHVPGTSQPYILAVDQNGEIVWFLNEGVQDLRLLRNGNLLTTSPGAATEITLEGTPVWTYSSTDLDGHEAYDMPDGNVLLLIDEVRQVNRGGQLQNWRGQQVVEVDRSGSVVWSWSPFDHLSTLDFDECYMEFPDPFGVYDWTHGNACVYDAVDNTVYYSSRHLSRIVKIDYATGNVIWNMGFDMPSGEVDFGDDLFSFQHSPQILSNGNIMIYDNGNRRGHSYCEPANPYSSSIEVSVDPGAPEPVKVVWEFIEPFFSPFVGDADRLPNGNTLVTAGANGKIFEVALDGTQVWEMTLPGTSQMYRAERVLSLYPLRGDGDGDDDVDLHDFGGFQSCFHGTDGFAIHRDCLVYDFDEDGDVDLDDFSSFNDAFTGDGD